MHTIFKALSVDGIRDFPAELGAFSLESLSVRYNFTQDEYRSALIESLNSDELPDHVKTVIHETTHLFHAITTPFGQLTYRLRALQTYLVADAIRTIREHGCRVSFPLVGLLRTLPRRVALEVEERLRVWYGIEILILVMFGEVDTWEKHLARNPYVRGVSLAALFAALQSFLAQYGTLQDRLYREYFEDMASSDGTAEAGRFEPDEVDVAEEIRLQAQLLSLDILGMINNTLAIIESAGTAAEFWGAKRLDVDQLMARVTNAPWASKLVPKSWLVLALGKVRAASVAELIPSYLAVCELALFGPVLPEHQQLRGNRIRLRELIIPFMRWWDLLNAASRTPPVTSLGDYERYTSALCETLGWIPPRQIVEADLLAGAHRIPAPRERMYWEAQAVRQQVPGAFIDYSHYMMGLTQEAQWFRTKFTFPVIEFRDKSLFHKDKFALYQFILNYLLRAVVRRMLIQRDLVVAAPYRALEDEKTTLAGDLSAVLEEALGIHVPGITVS